MDDFATKTPFDYPKTAHSRRHGPIGYRDYKNYKPWLRDEFAFRCVFCLARERWYPDGESFFSVEHLQPQSKEPLLVCDYHNLVLACLACNSAKQDVEGVLDPCREAFALHVRVDSKGYVLGLTTAGEELVAICHLNRPTLVEFRQRMMELWQLLTSDANSSGKPLLGSYFGYPDSLPDLSELRPPTGNTNPNGVSQSHFELRKRGLLSRVY
jgi:hypothetical protein